MTAAAAYWPTAVRTLVRTDVRTLVRTDVRTLVRTAPPAPRPDAAPPALEAPEDLAKKDPFPQFPLYSGVYARLFPSAVFAIYPQGVGSTKNDRTKGPMPRPPRRIDQARAVELDTHLPET